jgi:hypothetical protein
MSNYTKTLPSSAVRIICKVFDDKDSPEIFSSYTCENTSFLLSLSWNDAFTSRNFYSNNVVVWDFGDNTTLIAASAKHFYEYPKTYNVNATIFDKNGESYIISLEKELTANNIFPDYVYLHPLDTLGRPYNLPSGKRSDQIIVTRYNSWQNEKALIDNNYTINLYVSGSKSDHINLSSYYSEKYSHLKAFHGFVGLSLTEDNIIQSRIVESTKTNSVSVYALPYTTGMVDKNWEIKFNFYNYPIEGSCFVGSSGTNYDIDYVYFVDQKTSNYNGIDIIFATFDSKNFIDSQETKINYNIFKDYDQGYLNLPPSAQILKSTFNPANSIRITSNGISTEGNNSTVGKLSGQVVYPFDIYPIKWSNTKIPFVINFKDSENFNVKNYSPIYDFHTGNFNNKINDVNLKLLQYIDIDPLSEYSVLSSVELKDVVFRKNENVPKYNDSPYFAGTLECPNEVKVVAISATVMIQDTPVPKMYPIYGFLSQIGLSRIKRYDKISKYTHCGSEVLDFSYEKELLTFTNSSTANVHICFSPLKFLDNSKENRVFILDADNDKIYRSDIHGNIISLIDLSLMEYRENKDIAPTNKSFISHNGSASPAWCCTDKRGNAYVSLADSVSCIKIDYDTNIVSEVYIPPFQNLELYDSDLYRKKAKDIVTIKNSKKITRISDKNKDIVTILKFDQYYGFVGENSIIPGSIDVDSNDNVYVAYTHPLSNFICKYANDGELLNTIYFNHLEVPQEIIIDANDNIWVGIENINNSSTVNEERNDIVYFIDSKTLEKTIIREIDGLGMMTIDYNQNVYVLNKVNAITKIDSVNKTKSEYTFGQVTDQNPYLKDIGAIATDSSGELWVVNNADGKVYFADTNNLSVPLSAIPYEKLIDLGLTTINNLGSIYFVMGDWTGFRWINKFLKTETPKPRIISGLSTYFDILNPTPTIVKKGENFDSLTQMKSYIAQESLFDKKILLDDFMGQILGKNENVEEIGKLTYEKITNLVSNTSDIETCNIQELFSFAEEVGVDINKYTYLYPPSIRRSLDLLSISQRKLFGTPNSYNRNFPTISQSFFDKKNLGNEIKIKDGTFVAGDNIVSYELFSENYNLITNTIVPNYNYGDIVPLSSVNYNWGWGLVTGTREQSGSEIGQYYKFFKHVPNKNIEIYDNMIDFDSEMTTLTPHQSSFDDWSKFAGNMDKVLSYGIYKGLKIIK